MKAISLWNPWAEAARLNMKKNETRSWPTSYRGDVVICSAKRPMDQLGLEVALGCNIPVTCMKFGYALCVVEVYDCTPTETVNFSTLEWSLGDYSPGRFAWVTRNLRPLKISVPVVGKQGLFNLPPDISEIIKANL